MRLPLWGRSMDKAVKILAVLAIVFFCIQVFSDNKADVDIWGNVGFVKSAAWDQGFRSVNTFSFTEPGHPWINHEWLGQYVLHLTHTRFGNSGLILLKILLGLCVISAIYAGMRESCKSGPVKFLWLLLAVSTMGYGFSTRPHLFTYVLYALLLLFLRKKGIIKPAQLFLFPLLGIAWVNLHGAFFAGIILLVLYLGFECVKRLYSKNGEYASAIPLIFSAVILFFAASLINPYGLKLWDFIFYSSEKARPFLSEWAPFTRMEYLGEHIDFIVLSILSFFAVIYSRKAKDMTWLGILIASFLSAMLMRRNIPIFAITASFIIPEHLEDVAGGHLDGIVRRFSSATLVMFLSFFVIISAFYALTFNKEGPAEIEIPQDRFPVDVVRFMEVNKISGNALVFFDWAEYCIWKLYPGCRVFLDGRLFSAYSVDVVEDYFNFLYMDGDWENALKDYPTDIVFIHKANPVYGVMLLREGWATIYENNIAGLLLKKSAHPEFFEALEKGEVKYPRVAAHEYFP